MVSACASERPPSTSSSIAASSFAESDQRSSAIGKSFCRSSPKSSRAQLRLARGQPVAVAAHGVDLAVVREEVERVREIPGAERVGREAAVDERQRALERGIAQVLVVGVELRRAQQALVDEPLRRQAHDRELGLGHAGGRGGPLDAAADHIELALEGRLDRPCAARRRAGARPARDARASRPDALRAHRQVAPAERPLALLGADAHAQLLAAQPQDGVAGQEDDPDRVAARLAAGRAPSSSRNAARRNRCGSWVMIPAPSPVSGSAPVAPRWSRLASARERLPDELVARAGRRGGRAPARPQASCSNRGS